MDIYFYMSVYDLKQRILKGESFSKEFVFKEFESYRRKDPVIYNIETTNACNMRCEMCPRTTMMTRKIMTMESDTFKKIADQIKAYTKEEWEQWQTFVEKKYNIDRNIMSENHFFLHIIPQVIVLHGYGDPLLDKKLPERVKLLTENGIPSYFSCNPANIDVDKNLELFENGLNYIKYSIESVDDFTHKEIRGKASNFTNAYEKIVHLLEMKEKHDYDTEIVITMLDLKKQNQKKEFKLLEEKFKDLDVYIYLKSQDQQWYQDKYEGTLSLHWIEFCQFPWSSMTIKSNGESVMCVEDYNNEIILGDAKVDSLFDIWNGDKYLQFRKDHFLLTEGIKCSMACDMKLMGNMNLSGNLGN